MSQEPRRSGALRIACPNFAPAEVDALRSLLALIRPYLKQPWEIVPGASAEVILINLDLPDARLPAHGCAIGCAQKPRLHAAGTIHRPLRVPELLAVLTEAGARQPASVADDPPEGTVEWSYALRAWPLDFEQWPRPWWPVMALLSRGRHHVPEVAERVGLPAAEVERCLARLQQRELLDRHAERRHPAPPPTAQRGWRGLATRVGQLLGFAA